MKHILFACLLLFSFTAFAQQDEFDMWRETDCPIHALRTIIQNEGRINDTCPPLLAKTEKAIYILKKPYFRRMPDSFMGYKIYYINADSDAHYWYQKQQKEHIRIYYFSTMFLHYEFYHFWIIPVEMKKNKVWYGNGAWKLYYYFHHELNRYEYKSARYFEWDAKHPEQTSTLEFR